MFGDVVMGVDHEHFEAAFDRRSRASTASSSTPMSRRGQLKELCEAYKKVYREARGEPFPHRSDQAARAGHRGGLQELERAPRAIKLPPQINKITGLLGTAVNVQTMVFGNMGETRAPASASPATPRRARTSSTASS
jgi:pyruvate,orthophosphate dikinase